MQEKSILRFDVYRLDPANARLWRGKHSVNLPPKAFGVLHYLAEHPGQLVTKAELFQTVWPETVVTDSALTVCVKELRKVLRDNAKVPQYIETVHRRGYRFIGKVASSQHSVVSRQREGASSQYSVVSSPALPTQSSALSTQHSVLVGREAELHATPPLVRERSKRRAAGDLCEWRGGDWQDHARQCLSRV